MANSALHTGIAHATTEAAEVNDPWTKGNVAAFCSAHYFDVHHTVHDTLDRIDPATLPQNVACWAVTAWLAAQAPVSFGPVVV